MYYAAMGKARRVASSFIKKDYSFFLQLLTPGLFLLLLLRTIACQTGNDVDEDIK